MSKKKVLGRGLSALLDTSMDEIMPKENRDNNYFAGVVANISLEKIKKNPYQPRTDFDKNHLRELAVSIEKQGLIQPVTVRKTANNKYELITGERRFKAAALANMKEIPAFIRVADDQQMLELALVENIQRDNLNAIEIAVSFQRLIEECKLTQEEMSKRVGKKRTTITNYIRLLKLPAEIQIAIRDNRISMGHARALISVDDTNAQLKILKDIIQKELSVREVEKIVKNIGAKPLKPEDKKVNLIQIPKKFVSAKNKLTDKLGTEIELKRNNKGKGNIVIHFNSDEEFENIISVLNK